MMHLAVSVHSPLIDRLAEPLQGRVLSVHARTANLVLDGGLMLSLLHPDLGNGPGALLLPGPWPLPLSPGDPAYTAGGRLQAGPITVVTTGARLWAPPAPPGLAGARDPKGTLAALAHTGSRAGLLPAALAALGTGPPRPDGPAGVLFDMGMAGIADLRALRWESAARRLAGLGPGLTPAGDDLLAGFCCLLRRAGRPEAESLGQALAALPVSATTPLSFHFLHWAAQGVAGEHHLTWLDGLLTGAASQPHLARVLEYGATSGADWAAGALLALHLPRPIT